MSLMDRAKEALAKGSQGVQKSLGLRTEQETENQGLLRNLQSSVSEAVTLTWQQRLMGFAACAGLGLLCFLIASISMLRPVKFATAFTMGNILLVGSSFFLAGPAKQFKMMTKGGRLWASAGFVGSMILTLFVAFRFRSIFLTLPCLAVELFCMLYYLASYVPFGQQMLRSACTRCCGDTFDFEV